MKIRHVFYLSTILGFSTLAINTINNQIDPDPGECRYKFNISGWYWYGHCRGADSGAFGSQPQLD